MQRPWHMQCSLRLTIEVSLQAQDWAVFLQVKDLVWITYDNLTCSTALHWCIAISSCTTHRLMNFSHAESSDPLKISLRDKLKHDTLIIQMVRILVSLTYKISLVHLASECCWKIIGSLPSLVAQCLVIWLILRKNAQIFKRQRMLERSWSEALSYNRWYKSCRTR